ncbi:alpha/beta fold hydrolase [Amycolatopsis sp. NPDC051758]|uniref:alpha/beta fold hydrolase n=1 Tax=Amycolatopsis sp. NPDC051758 TaxID=3363935 RepID=UPI0037907E29
MPRITLHRPDAVLAGTRIGDGPGVLLLHAGGERREVWQPVAETLAAHGFRCTAYDQRGHGDSGAAGADELTTHAADVAAMIAAEPAPPTVVGASLGGLATLLALTDQDLSHAVSGVVLVDVVAQLDPVRVRHQLNQVRDGYGDLPLVLDVLSRDPQLVAGTRGLTDLPTLLVCGELSALTEQDRRRFTDQVPHATVTTVPGASHLVARDAPAELARLLLDHLNSPLVRRRRIDRLLAATDVPHPGGTLRAHLDRTADTLEAWGAAAWLVDAGRLHAAYGTDGFPEGIPGLTPATILAAAGAETAHLVALYGGCDRARSYPTLLTDRPEIINRHTSEAQALTPEQVRAFAELTAANELDVVRHSPSIAAEHGDSLARLFTRLAPLLSPGARAAWSAMSETLRRARSGT